MLQICGSRCLSENILFRCGLFEEGMFKVLTVSFVHQNIDSRHIFVDKIFLYPCLMKGLNCKCSGASSKSRSCRSFLYSKCFWFDLESPKIFVELSRWLKSSVELLFWNKNGGSSLGMVDYILDVNLTKIELLPLTELNVKCTFKCSLKHQ